MQERRLLKVVAAIVAGLLALGVVGSMAYYRLTYHTFAWWEVPSAISYCGREYLRGSTVPELPAGGWSYTRVMTVYPEDWPVSTKQPTGGGVNPAVPGLPCAMGLVLKRGNGGYVQYGLSGGP